MTQFDPLNETDTANIGDGGPFPIHANLTVTVPAGGVSWDSLTNNQIRFTKKGNIKSVDLWYAVDGTNFTTKINGLPIVIEDGTPGDAARVGGAAGPNAGPYFYDWTIPDATPLSAGSVAKIKARAVDPINQANVSVETASAAFEVKGSLTVATPTATGISLVYGGSPYDITWTKGGAITNVKLYYSTNGGGNYSSFPINGGVAVPVTPASYAWTVPDNIGNNLVIRVVDNNNANVFDVSDNSFTILGSVVLNQPDTTITHWYVGDTNSILWTPTGTYGGSIWPNVEFHYDPDAVAGVFGGADVAAVAPDATKANTATLAQGTANWLIPDAIGSNVKVRVRVAGSPVTVEDITTNAFKIVGKITAITGPVASEVWYAQDTTRKIKWSATGNVSTVNIDYKTSAGGAWVNIVTGATTGGGNIVGVGASEYTWPSIPIGLKT
ncbi:MAG: hypothetical protein AAB265_00625, partial [candidate division NC10 bacterium]